MRRCTCSCLCCCRRRHYYATTASYYTPTQSLSCAESSSESASSSDSSHKLNSASCDSSSSTSHRSSTSSTSVEAPPPQPPPSPPPKSPLAATAPSTLLLVLCLVLALLSLAAATAEDGDGGDPLPIATGTLPVHKYSTRVVRTKYGPLRGVVLRAHPPVEAFLGVPYASPPLGALRYMPPVTPSMWRTTRLADAFAPVCPQRAPDIGNRTEALLEFPRGRLLYLEKLLPLLANQSEDCLYLNVYVPRGAPSEPMGPLPTIVYVHGESFEWNSGNPYDGSVLAGYGRVIVVTLNFRLGILGFLKTGARGSAQGNFGLMDLVAGLHWLRENLPAFGGDPERVTLLGHGTGAALANFIAVSPVAKELLHRVVLLSGSGLSPWALQRDPLFVKRKVAEQTGCHGDLLDDDLAPCLRTKPLQDLLAVRVDAPRFLPGFAPFVDGTVLAPPPSSARQPPPPAAAAAAAASAADPLLLGTPGTPSSAAAGAELADFPERDLLFGLTTTESYLDLSAQDLEYGLNESRRDRILRTYVRNAYYFHLNEIFSTLKNEYTDWERPVQNPLSVRDSTLEVLSDGHTAAPLVRVGYLHTLRGGRTYFLHFQHQSGERDFPQRAGSVRGEDVPYVLGLPLVGGLPFFPHDYTRQDQGVSRLLIHYLANFARKGDPNSSSGPHHGSPVAAAAAAGAADVDAEMGVGAESVSVPSPAPFWDTYDSINQLYMELGSKAEMKNHYRGHKMSLWLNLIPQLHRPGGDDMSMRHHHFQEEGAQYYEGLVRQQSMSRPPPSSGLFPPPATPATTTAQPTTPRTVGEGMGSLDAVSTTTECPPNATGGVGAGAHGAAVGGGGGNSGGGSGGNTRPATSKEQNNNNLLRKLASSHYQSYTTALTVTIAVGCFLLLLNILIFAGIYHQRDRGGAAGGFGNKKKDELAEAGSCSSSSGDHYEAKHALLLDHVPPLSASQQHLHRGAVAHASASGATVELPIQEFKSSPTAALKRQLLHQQQAQQQAQEQAMLAQQVQLQYRSNPGPSPQSTSPPRLTSPSIPEPPPPPKNQPPAQCNQSSAAGGGILRQQGCPQTPGSMKKRVQIQEISV